MRQGVSQPPQIDTFSIMFFLLWSILAPKLDRVIIQGVFRPAESISDVRVKIQGIIFIGIGILVSCVKFKFTFHIDASFINLKFTKKILQLKFAYAFTGQPDSGTLRNHAYRDQRPRKHYPASFSQSKTPRPAHTRHNRDSGTPYSNRSSGVIFIVLSALENIPLRHFRTHQLQH